MPLPVANRPSIPAIGHVNDLLVQVPVKFELAINIKAAKGLGITIPDLFLLRADEVIE
jgi:putative tryptophan/tyrosine transport system substrate-binding protein